MFKRNHILFEGTAQKCDFRYLKQRKHFIHSQKKCDNDPEILHPMSVWHFLHRPEAENYLQYGSPESSNKCIVMFVNCSGMGATNSISRDPTDFRS